MTTKRERRPGNATARRRHPRSTFDQRVGREYRRYAGEPRRLLVRQLRERFLARHLPRRPPVLLELGPGPGRFTPSLLAAPPRRLIAVDLSRPILLAGRRRLRAHAEVAHATWVRGAGEHLPLRDGSVDVAVVLGNVVCMAAREGPKMLRELHRVTRPGALLLVDFATAAGAAEEFFYTAARHKILIKVLRRPEYYLIDQVLRSGYQPNDPARLASWEFQFYTPETGRRALGRAGFRALDLMAVGPLVAFHDHIAKIARRDPTAWENLLRIEERVGRRPGVTETGHGFIVAARRR
jgi:ubiquinone/menaquinone biosynthesis C-methylase UbiE